MYTTLKTDIIKLALVFSISKFLLTKILSEGNLFVNKVPTTANSAVDQQQIRKQSFLDIEVCKSKNALYLGFESESYCSESLIPA